MKKTSAILGIAAMLLLTGCTATTATPPATPPPVTTAPPTTPTPTPTPEPEQGTRANPLAPGESRKLTADSMWIVGATGPTKIKDGYIVLPLELGFDWEAGRAQADDSEEPWDVDNEGIDPSGSIIISFVSKGGRTYDEMNDYTVSIKNQFYNVGTVYPPTDRVKANVAVSVPKDEVAGGSWRVENYVGDAVFISVD